jgi:Family of unknown function (DUF6283)
MFSDLKKSKIILIKPVDDNHQVVSVVYSQSDYMRKPCGDCPWRKDAVGIFPAKAFKISAHTSYDMAQEKFGCHTAGTCNPKTCAGFLLQGAYHNLSYRLGKMKGMYNDVSDGGHELFNSYKEMAIANGVPATDDSLKLSRDD